MKRLSLSLATLVLTAWALPVSAQESTLKVVKTPPPAPVAPVASVGSVATPASRAPVASLPADGKATPEMWFYQQYQQQYRDPKAMVRARAEFQDNERQRRMASLKWYGFSNSRPQASTDYINNDNSPRWVSGDALNPSRWPGDRAARMVLPSSSTMK